MTTTKHKASSWRVSRAQGFEDQVASITAWLEVSEEILALFEETGDELISELRILAAEMRMRRNDLSAKAAALRAEVEERSDAH